MAIKQYLLPLLKWWWLLLACTLVATGSSYLASRQLEPVYSTRATVMVGSAIENPNPNGNELYLTQQLANTYVDMVKRDTVRAKTAQALGLSGLPQYSARVVPGTQLIELSVTDTSPERAQAVANELVNQLVLLSPSGAGREDAQRQVFIAGQLDELEANITATQEEIRKKQSDLANLFSARQIADTQTQITAMQDKLAALQANYAAMLANTQAGALNSIRVIEPAALPTVPVGPQKMYMVLLAAAIGFLLAACAAYLLEYLDDTIKNPEDVQTTLGLATLGAVPHADGALVGDERDLLVVTDGRSKVAEAYRVLRTNLQFVSVNHPMHALLVTSPAPHEGKSITAANLAGSIAQAGRRVILVDTDLHRPRLHKLVQARNNIGVTTALVEEVALDTVLQATHVPGLRILSSGPLPPNPAELLSSDRMLELVTQLKARADVVVFDSPPITAVADAAILSRLCDGVLLVLNAGTTRRGEAKRALQALGQVGARVIGALLNQMPMGRSGYYYYYKYGYDQDNGKARSRIRWPWRRRAQMLQGAPDLTQRSDPLGHAGGGPEPARENGTGRKARVHLP